MIGRLARFLGTAKFVDEVEPFANAADATDDPVLLGEEAQRILDSPVMATAFDRVDKKLIRTARNTGPAETDKREEAYRLVWALEALKTELLAIAGNGKMKAAEGGKR